MILLASSLSAQNLFYQPSPVSFPTDDGGTVFAHLYGKGKRGVVLLHLKKESWREQADHLTTAGFRVLAAVRYLRKEGAKSVAVVGGSLGGGAGADADFDQLYRKTESNNAHEHETVHAIDERFQQES